MMSPWPAAVAVMAPISGRLSDRFPAGLLGAIGLALMATGLLSLALLPMHPAWWDVAWRMSLTGIGFGLFQSPNNRLLLSSVPRERSGTGSGMLSSARLTGQSFGAGLAAVAFGLNEAAGAGQGAFIAVLVAAGFAAIGAAFSSLRLVATAKES
jgi:DHA2 family multidrug resistance protein-like MFS transporter